MRPRMFGFLECGESKDGAVMFPNLHCPHGHRVLWEYAFHEAGYPRCSHKAPNGGGMCNARLFVQFFPRLNAKAHPMIFVVEITGDEIMEVTRRGLDVPGIMSYLGVTWNPPQRVA